MRSRRCKVLILAFLLTIAALLPVAEKEQTPAFAEQTTPGPGFRGSDYIIGPGDVLHISVWEEEALTKLVAVLPDGKISYPLIGELMAAGKSINQLRKKLVRELTPYIPDPVVTVGVEQVNSMHIYVIGKVNSPGRFLLNTNVNVLQALATAGGLNAFAKRGKIKIFRNRRGKTRIYQFDYNEVSSGEKLNQNIVLDRGDVIVVP